MNKYVKEVDKLFVSQSNLQSFIEMSISYCVDSSKQYAGVCLEPKLHTFDLSHRIEQSLHILKYFLNSSFRQKFEIIADSDITLIVTDQSWFQFNLLNMIKLKIDTVSNCEIIKIDISLINSTSMKRSIPTSIINNNISRVESYSDDNKFLRVDIYEDLSYLNKQENLIIEKNLCVPSPSTTSKNWKERLDNDKNLNIMEKRLNILGIFCFL